MYFAVESQQPPGETKQLALDERTNRRELTAQPKKTGPRVADESRYSLAFQFVVVDRLNRFASWNVQ